MNNRFIAATAVFLIVTATLIALPATAQTPSPNDIRLTAAALRVDVAANSAQAKALEMQAREIERQQAVATAAQRSVDATQTAIYRPTSTLVPTATPQPTSTPMPTLTTQPTGTASIAQPTPIAAAISIPRTRLMIYLENITAPALAAGLLLVMCAGALLVIEATEKRRKK